MIKTENTAIKSQIIKNPLVIAGSGRSGTTWVLDSLAQSNGLRTIFEPLNPFEVKDAKPFANIYIDETSENFDLEQFLMNVFSGKINNLWPNTRILPSKLIPAFSQIKTSSSVYNQLALYKKFLLRYSNYFRSRSRYPITKFIRANSILDWMKRKFNARIVFIVRHPVAVAASKIYATSKINGEVWDFNGPVQQAILNNYKQNEQFKNDYLCQYKDIFDKNLSPVAGHTFLWCLENIIPFNSARNNKLDIFFYEDIIQYPEKEFNSMAEVLNLSNIPELSHVTKPSQQTPLNKKNFSFGKDQLTGWMEIFNSYQIAEIDYILKLFNVTVYNAHEPIPVGGF